MSKMTIGRLKWLILVGLILSFMLTHVATILPEEQQSLIGTISWQKYHRNPVLGLGQHGSWDEDYASNATVIFDTDESLYKMWYVGFGEGDHEDQGAKIGYATSPDGLHWTKYPGNPVLTPGPERSWDSAYVTNPCVIKVGQTYKMWYRGSAHRIAPRIGYATSSDGIHWRKFADNPVIRLHRNWKSNGVYDPEVLYNEVEREYQMWYAGFDNDGGFRIGYATSPEGIGWTRYWGNPVLDVGSRGSWDDQAVSAPSIVLNGTEYEMWFGGSRLSKEGYYEFRIGYAVSQDGIHWAKSLENPVLTPGPEEGWDDYAVHIPEVIFDGTKYRMWYSGTGGRDYKTQVGYAEGIKLNQSPIASFTYWPSKSTDIDKIHFIDKSTDPNGNIIEWHWDFGDESTSNEQNPTHQYKDDGTYTVKLIVTDDHGATDSITKGVTVSNVSPKANFTYLPSEPIIKAAITFDASSSSDPDGKITKYQWDFDGDGKIDKEGIKIEHTYNQAGKYRVMLTVTDDDGDTNTIEKEVEVITPPPEIKDRYGIIIGISEYKYADQATCNSPK